MNFFLQSILLEKKKKERFSESRGTLWSTATPSNWPFVYFSTLTLGLVVLWSVCVGGGGGVSCYFSVKTRVRQALFLPHFFFKICVDWVRGRVVGQSLLSICKLNLGQWPSFCRWCRYFACCPNFQANFIYFVQVEHRRSAFVKHVPYIVASITNKICLRH